VGGEIKGERERERGGRKRARERERPGEILDAVLCRCPHVLCTPKYRERTRDRDRERDRERLKDRGRGRGREREGGRERVGGRDRETCGYFRRSVVQISSRTRLVAVAVSAMTGTEGKVLLILSRRRNAGRKSCPVAVSCRVC